MCVHDLIYDVGLHRGEDTAYYLRKGYRVVAFEANPDLVQHCRQRFATELCSGQLEIIEGAIADTNARSITFYEHPYMSVWGTTDTMWVERNASNVTAIEVPVVRFRSHLERTGTPYFVKIDIEGADDICLSTLVAMNARPVFMSIEAEKVRFDRLQTQLTAMEQLGFDRFAAVQQADMNKHMIETRTRSGEPFTYRFEADSSGGFGCDIARWMSREELEHVYRPIFRRYRVLGDDALINRTQVGFRLRSRLARRLGRPLPGWYDTHAARSSRV
jgi:FkbM family methyltransferase